MLYETLRCSRPSGNEVCHNTFEKILRFDFHKTGFIPIDVKSPLTHCGRVTHNGDGSMLCKSPIFFIMK